MKREYFRYGSIFVFITCFFALLVSCGSSGGDEEGGPGTASITLNEPPEDGIPADGVSSFAIEATVTDASGEPVADGTFVTFSTTLGAFPNDSTTYTGSTTTGCETGGFVVVSLIAGTTPGIAKVSVECSGVTQSISITFTYAGSGGNMPVGEGFSLFPDYHNISGLWIAGLQDPITAWVLDVNGNAVKDSTPIEFKTYNTGGLLDPCISATLGGFALSTLTSTPAPAPQQGFVSVTAETTGGPTTRVTSLAVTPYPYDYIMYAGTNGGGVYKSTDRGANWVNISRSSENPKQGQNWIEPYIKGHSAICVDPDDRNTVYVGTGYSGKGNVYRTLDGGMNWNSNNVEEWNGMNIYRSLDGGEAAVLTVLCDGDDTATDYPYVWIGTEGRGILYAGDGENFQPSGGTVTTPVSGPGNTGNGTMSDPILYYSSKTETWTATCVVPGDASAATVPEFDGSGDGWMSNVTTSLTTKTEDWAVTYQGGAGPASVTGAGDGTVVDIEVKTAVTETWTLTCIDNTTAGSEVFSVTGSVSGAQLNATVDTAYDSDAIAFTIIIGANDFALTDTITFDTTTYWQAAGTVSGVQTNTAASDTAYTSDNGEVGFTITEESVPFAIGDFFTFSTTGASAPFWRVEGTVSGLQWRWAENNVPYTSDNYEVSFTIYEGTIAFAAGDTFTFSVTANTLGHGRTVWDIVKVPHTHGPAAVLYAAAATGVFKSVNGGQTWDETTSFTGDSISTLTLHPASTGAGNDIIYAGTLNAGTWVSTNSGASWTQYPGGMEMGQSAGIKDLLLDPMNARLYAITIQGTPDQAVGNVYSHALNADGSMATGQWSKANTGLAGVGLHAMAADNPLNPGALFAGGEGINLYKATGSELTTGAPAWQVSKSGLTNRIMARKPILFSGKCGLDVSYWEYEGAYYFTVYVQDINGNPPITRPPETLFIQTFTTFKAELRSGSGLTTFFDIIYDDCYTHQGTFSDPGNGYTNNPYRFAFFPLAGDELTIEFTSADTRHEHPDPPGYSGVSQTRTYHF